MVKHNAHPPKPPSPPNVRLNPRPMELFRNLLQDLELTELHLNGRLYT
jgi:hypothetical protein